MSYKYNRWIKELTEGFYADADESVIQKGCPGVQITPKDCVLRIAFMLLRQAHVTGVYRSTFV